MATLFRKSLWKNVFIFFLTFKDVPNVLNLPRLIVVKEKNSQKFTTPTSTLTAT